MLALSGRQAKHQASGIGRSPHNGTVPAIGSRGHHLQRGRRVTAAGTHTAPFAHDLTARSIFAERAAARDLVRERARGHHDAERMLPCPEFR